VIPGTADIWKQVDVATIVAIAAFFAVAWTVHALASHLARPLLGATRLTAKARRPSPERERTLLGLLANTLSLLAFALALLFSLAMFINAEALIWMVGLFSAAFGLGARPLVSDFLSGVSLLFEDTFAVGDKVELLEVEGVVEAVNLRTTWIRAPTGELYIVPNGEVRVVRNFSRGLFSTASLTVRIEASQLARAVELLERTAADAQRQLPTLIEPWQVISRTGELGHHTELTILAKTRFGEAAEARPRLAAFVHERLAESGVELSDKGP
jgi:small conductance mechanosensitive channel